MPMYDFKCLSCGECSEAFVRLSFLSRERHCESCGGVLRRKVGSRVTVSGDLKPWVEHNIDDKPMLIKSRRHLRQVCKEHEVYVK